MSWYPPRRLDSEAPAASDASSSQRLPRIARLAPAPRPLGSEGGQVAAPDPPLERLLIRGGEDHLLLVRLEDVDWIEGDGNYVVLHEGQAAHRHRLSSLASRLDSRRFARIHRSTIVRIDRIRELRPTGSGGYELVLRDGVTLSLSRGYQRRFFELLES
jgi:two-component system LytT family response regulator